MDYKFELSENAAQQVLSIRTVTSVANLPQEIGKAYHAIIDYLNEIGEKPFEAPFAIYYNMDVENLDVEMGFPVSKFIPEKGDIKAGEIPAGKHASIIYKGSYSEMGPPAYEALTKWVGDRGYEPTGVCYEYYYNSPLDVPESELLTKVVFPLK